MKLSTMILLVVLLAVDSMLLAVVVRDRADIVADLFLLASPAMNVLVLVAARRPRSVPFLLVGGSLWTTYSALSIFRPDFALRSLQSVYERGLWDRLGRALAEVLPIQAAGWTFLAIVSLALSGLLLMPAVLAQVLFKRRPEAHS